MFPNTKRKQLDPVRFGALKGKHYNLLNQINKNNAYASCFTKYSLLEFTIKTCSLQPGTVAMLEFERKLKNVTGDARKKFNRTEKN